MSEQSDRPAVEPGEGSQADGQPGAPLDFDPYRFGKPDQPVPAEYAPLGYTPDPPASPQSYPPPAEGPYGSAPGYPSQPHGRSTPSGQPTQPPWTQPRPGYPMPPPQWSGAPGGYPSAHEQGGNGRAVAGLVLGIVSIVMFWLSFLNVVFLVLGLIFGLLGLRNAKVRNGAGRGLAVAGLICTAAGFAVTAVYTVWLVGVANDCGGLSNGRDPGFQQCIQDHL